jgi:hypothetical protein
MFASLLGLPTSYYVSEKNKKAFLPLENTYCELTNYIVVDRYRFYADSDPDPTPTFTQIRTFFYFYSQQPQFTVTLFIFLVFILSGRTQGVSG